MCLKESILGYRNIFAVQVCTIVSTLFEYQSEGPLGVNHEGPTQILETLNQSNIRKMCRHDALLLGKPRTQKCNIIVGIACCDNYDLQ